MYMTDLCRRVRPVISLDCLGIMVKDPSTSVHYTPTYLDPSVSLDGLGHKRR